MKSEANSDGGDGGQCGTNHESEGKSPVHAQRSYKADVTCGIVLACGQSFPRFSLALARVTNVSCRLQPGTTLLVTLATAEERHERVTSIVGGVCGTSSQDVKGISPHKFDARLQDG